MWPWVGQRLKQCGRKDAEQAYGNLRNETTKRNNETTKRNTDETTKANNESKQRKQTTKQRNETKQRNRNLVAILQRYSSQALKSSNFVPLKVRRTCVEENLGMCWRDTVLFSAQILMSHLPLIGDPFLLSPFVAFFAVPVFTVSTSMFLFSTKRRDVPFGDFTKAAFWITFPVKIATEFEQVRNIGDFSAILIFK